MWPPDSAEIPVTRRGKFPGLQPPDADVLRRALDAGVIAPDKMWLNVPVGPVPDWARDGALAPFAARMQQIYQRRIDLVIQTGDRLEVVEIKPLGSPTALGQAILYRDLAQAEPDRPGEITASILCDCIQPDCSRVCRQAGIRCRELRPSAKKPVPPENHIEQMRAARPKTDLPPKKREDT